MRSEIDSPGPWEGRIEDWCPREVAAELRSGRPLLLVARNSTGASTKGRDLAARDAQEAAAALDAFGVKVSDVVPDVDELVADLKSTKDRLQVGGRAISIVSYWFLGGSLRVIVAAGSGTKWDDGGSQPFLARLTSEAEALRPALVFSKHADRLGRDEIGAILLYRALDVQERSGFGPGWVGSLRHLRRGSDREAAIVTYVESRQDRDTAEKIAVQTRLGRIQRTGQEMVNGSCPYAFGQPPPPGLMAVRLVREQRPVASRLLYVDALSNLPSDDIVSGRVPLAVDIHGRPADQVELVRWALSEFAQGRNVVEIGEELRARGFTSPQLRIANRPDSSYLTVQTFSRPRLLMRSILLHIDLYETGEWSTKTGEGIHVIRGCLSPDGQPWVSPENAAMIRERMSSQRAFATVREARTTMVGLHALVNGVPARLETNHPVCARGGIS